MTQIIRNIVDDDILKSLINYIYICNMDNPRIEIVQIN